MALHNAMRSSDSLSTEELARLESLLQKDGYRLVEKANEGDLLPGEYLKRQRSSYIYTFASPVTWQVVWADQRKAARTDSQQGQPAVRH